MGQLEEGLTRFYEDFKNLQPYRIRARRLRHLDFLFDEVLGRGYCRSHSIRAFILFDSGYGMSMKIHMLNLNKHLAFPFHELSLIGCFFLIQYLYAQKGVVFDFIPLAWFWQYLDIDLLKHDLMRSLFYLHSQPPLFNLFLGVVLKAAPSNVFQVFQAIFLVLGIVFTLGLYRFLVNFRVSPTLAVLFTLVFIATPQFVLYGNWLFYTFPAMVLLLLGLFFIKRYLDRSSKISAFIGFFLLAMVSLTVSMFPLVWFLVNLLCVYLLVEKKEQKEIKKIALVPLILIVAVLLKNAVVFGSFNSSSWTGLNLNRMTLVSTAHKRAWIAQGRLSPLTIMPGFQPIDKFPPGLMTQKPWGVPALDAPYKSSGEPNYNYIGYIALSRLYLRESLDVISWRPQDYLLSCAMAYNIFCLPSTYGHHVIFSANQEKVEDIEGIFNDGLMFFRKLQFFTYRIDFGEKTLLQYGQPAVRYVDFDFYVTLVFFLYPVLILWALWKGFSLGGKRVFDRNEKIMLLLLALNILWVMLVGNMIDIGENNRYRKVIDPLAWVLLAVMAQKVWEKLKQVGKEGS